MPLNAEFKARVADLAPVRARLAAMQPRWAGVDAQRDTYFDAPNGRLKLREGTVETALIAYTRADIAGVKRSDVTLAPLTPDAAAAVGAALAASLGVRTVVEKTREIAFVGHVKVHLDTLAGLGTLASPSTGWFVEVEAIDTDGTRTLAALTADADAMRTALGLDGAVLESRSYADMVG